jgi:hypothetical protein
MIAPSIAGAATSITAFVGPLPQGPFAAVVGGLYVPLGPTVSAKRMVMAAPTDPKREGPRDSIFSSGPRCGANAASSGGSGEFGPRIDKTCVTPAAECSPSSGMPQIVMRGAVRLVRIGSLSRWAS